MKRNGFVKLVPLLVAAALAAGATVAAAQTAAPERRFDVSLLAGLQTVNKNDTALPDYFLSIPAVASAAWSVTPNLAVEGDLTWMIPMKRSVDLGSGSKQDRKLPNLLAYQAGLRASLPLASWTPYVAAGAGAVTFLSSTDADRLPPLGDSQTLFALNFGGGTNLALAPQWGLRADFRELVAFPAKDAEGLSSNGQADAIWMERASLGFTYRF